MARNDVARLALAELNLQPRPVLDAVSVLIPTLGRGLLENSLARIVVGDAWPRQLIVVDQGENPEVGTWMAKLRAGGLNVQHVQSKQRGRSAAINRGLERVSTQFVVVTDDDCLVAPGWLARMARRLTEKPHSIITGRVEPAGDEETALSIVISRVPRTYHRPELRAQPLVGGNMGLSIDIVARVGPFDEHPTIHSAEDNDWGYRALRLGIPIVYDPDILVHHFNWRNPEQRTGRFRHYASCQGAFYGKYLLEADRIILAQTARDLVRGPVRWLRGILCGNADMTANGRADSLYMVPGILAGIRRRRERENSPPGWPRNVAAGLDDTQPGEEASRGHRGWSRRSRSEA
jgi:GT2 family glycosyltransferase